MRGKFFYLKSCKQLLCMTHSFFIRKYIPLVRSLIEIISKRSPMSRFQWSSIERCTPAVNWCRTAEGGLKGIVPLQTSLRIQSDSFRTRICTNVCPGLHNSGVSVKQKGFFSLWFEIQFQIVPALLIYDALLDIQSHMKEEFSALNPAALHARLTCLVCTVYFWRITPSDRSCR